jgi:hypothetical protein
MLFQSLRCMICCFRAPSPWLGELGKPRCCRLEVSSKQQTVPETLLSHGLTLGVWATLMMDLNFACLQ